MGKGAQPDEQNLKERLIYVFNQQNGSGSLALTTLSGGLSASVHLTG
jgi:hypothetical protein